MSEITDRFRDAFRPYVVDGVPGSGPNKPGKADLQALGGLIDNRIDTVETGLQAQIAAVDETLTDAIAAQNSTLTASLEAVEALALQGVKPAKAAVRALVITDVNLATNADNGKSFGGVTLATGNRIAKAVPGGNATNGIYVVQASGAAVRATDFDTSGKIIGGVFAITEGTYAGTRWGVQNTAAITVGTTAIDIIQIDATSADVATKSGAETLSNKTIPAPIVTNPKINGSDVLSPLGLSAAGEIDTNDVKFEKRTDLDAFVVTDANYWVDAPADFDIDDTSSVVTTGGFTKEELVALNAEAAAYSQEINNRPLVGLTGAIYQDSVQQVYGQSLAEASYASIPAISKTAVLNGVMIGASVRTSSVNATFDPFTDCDYRPLIATNDRDNNTMLDEATLTTWASGGWTNDSSVVSTSFRGEESSPGFVYTATLLYNARKGYNGVDPNMRFVSVNSAAGGSTIAQLSTTPHYDRLVDSARKAKALSDEASRTVGIACVRWVQGEADATTPKATYKAAMIALMDAHFTDVVQGIMGQTEGKQIKRPVWLVHYPGKRWANAAMGVPEALAELAAENDHVVDVGPTYHLLDGQSYVANDDHLASNSERWLGVKDGQVFDLIHAGQGWRSMHIKRVVHKDNWLAVLYHVPRGRVAFGKPLKGNVYYEPLTRGFAASDGSGALTVMEVPTPTYSHLVLIRVNRNVASGGASLLYADPTHFGRGCIRDTDPFKSPYNFELVSQSRTADEYDTGILNQPYAMYNWARPQLIVSTAL